MGPVLFLGFLVFLSLLEFFFSGPLTLAFFALALRDLLNCCDVDVVDPFTLTEFTLEVVALVGFSIGVWDLFDGWFVGFFDRFVFPFLVVFVFSIETCGSNSLQSEDNL
jgi:hypothetical protein